MTSIGKEKALELIKFKPYIGTVEGPWSFKPAFTPAQMLEMGVFGHNYFGGDHAKPEDFEGIDPETQIAITKYGTRGQNSWKDNCFGVKAGMDYDWWMEKGLIREPDNLGWFHWYCRFHAGRRDPKMDNWQIARWQNFKRWVTNGTNQYVKHGVVSRVVLQSLLQWSYDPWACYADDAEFDNVRPPISMQERG